MHPVFSLFDNIRDFPIAKSYLYKQVNWGEPITLSFAEWREYIKETKDFLDRLDLDSLMKKATNHTVEAYPYQYQTNANSLSDHDPN